MESVDVAAVEGSAGQVITFYSFKGGVGRTMALANVGFLAACNNMRVLVIDWDLEAPGLSYYFRGLLDPAAARELRQSPGVLNILWRWVSALKDGRTEADVERTADQFRSGEPFASCVREVADSRFFRNGGCLDFIGAGSPRVEVPESTDYEDALARFPWHDFFEQLAGGYVAQSLRAWAKGRYDLVLIDSRTGLAEAAGLCTMHLPDAVALCFVLNRQNIDGVARIASAVRAKREGMVKLLAAPMRVGPKETPEESDARARAISELTRIGGFSPDAAQQQLRSLAVYQADNVPFYETLAPIVAEDRTLDALTLNYLRLGSELIGRRLSAIDIDPNLLASVRARLQPRHATAEYVAKLTGSEPVRAIEELQRLLDSAQEMAVDGNDFEQGYVQALVSAAFAVNEPQYLQQIVDLQRQAMDLLRLLRTSDDDWRLPLIEALEMHLASAGPVLEHDEEIALLEELDSLLAPNVSSTARLRRITSRRRAAWLYARENQFEAANQTVGEIFAQVKDLRTTSTELSPENQGDLLATEADTRLLRGWLAERKKEPVVAGREYGEALRVLGNLDLATTRPELRRLCADAHLRIALLEGADIPIEQRRRHAVDAARWAGATSGVLVRFTDLVNMLLGGPDVDGQMSDFLELALGLNDKAPRSVMVSYFGRTPRQATIFLETAQQVAMSFGPHYSSRAVAILLRLAQIAESIIIQVARRRITLGGRASGDLLMQFERLGATLRTADLHWEPSHELREAVSSLGSSARRARSAAP